MAYSSLASAVQSILNAILITVQALIPSRRSVPIRLKHLRLGTGLISSSLSALEMMVCIWFLKNITLSGLTAPGCAKTSESAALSCQAQHLDSGALFERHTSSSSLLEQLLRVLHLCAVNHIVRKVLGKLPAPVRRADQQLPALLPSFIEDWSGGKVQLPRLAARDPTMAVFWS